MEWEFIIVLVFAIPIILLPVAYIWYLNVGGIFSIVREVRRKRSSRQGKDGEDNEAGNGPAKLAGRVK